MAEGKYGRLFTERDVLAIVDEAIMAVVDSFNAESMEDVLRVLIERAEADKAPMTFPADEPLFLLRGQDKAAPSAIQENPSPGRDYWMAAARVGASDEHLKAVATAAREMRDWQAANPDRVKIPD